MLNRDRGGVGWIKALIVVLTMASPVLADDLEAIRSQAAAQPRRLTSYQFESTSVYPTSPPETAIKNSMRVYQEGACFRAECDAPESQIGNVISAFNGARYQQFHDRGKILTFSREPRFPTLYWLLNPVVAPYFWLADGMTLNWADAGREEVWRRRFEGAKYVGRETHAGRECHVVAVPVRVTAVDEPVEEQTAHVYFAEQLDYYPLKTLVFSKSGELMLKVETTSFKSFDVNGGRLVVPLSVDFEAVSPAAYKMPIVLSEASIRINPLLDEELFTISPSTALLVDDWDLNSQPLPPGELPAQPVERGWRSWAIVANVVAMAALVTAFVRSRWKKRGA